MNPKQKVLIASTLAHLDILDEIDYKDPLTVISEYNNIKNSIKSSIKDLEKVYEIENKTSI